MNIIRIVIAEDQTLMRQGLRTILELEEGFKVSGEAANGEEAVRLAASLHPDVILMDVQMPRLNGIEAMRQILSAPRPPKVIILTTFDREEYVFEGIRAGASGFLLKDAPSEMLLDTIRKVAAGEKFIQPEIATRALTLNLQGGGFLEPLSDREKEVLQLIAQGIPNKEIADRIHLSEGTVKNHVSSILSKLQVQNRTQAANVARKKGII
jgi:RNA polymerase sigma factor (sigma-70 family)